MVKIFGQEFAQDPALKDFKDPASIIKAYKDTKAMLGKPRFDVPTAETPPEEAAKFYEKMGVPKTAADYGLKPDANVPEHNNDANVKFLGAFGEKAHELKLTTAQATGMQKFFDDLTVSVGKEAETRAAAEDKAIDEMYTKAFGDKKIQATEEVRAVIEKAIPKEMIPVLADKLDTNTLTALAYMNEYYKKEYGQSDENRGDGGNNTGATDINSLREQGQKLHAEMLKMDRTSQAYKTAKASYDNVYQQIRVLQAGKK